MASIKLKRAATSALRDFMGLDEGETLLVITDEYGAEVGSALYEAGKKLCAEAFYVEMRSRGRNGEEPPEQIARLMREVDVVVCPTAKSLTHTRARREASKLGVRIGTMPGITEDTLSRCLSADPKQIVEDTERVASVMEGSTAVRVTTALGTDIAMGVKGRHALSSTGVLRRIGESGNLPSGEVYLAPLEGSSEGVVVFDGSIAGIGILSSPVTVTVKEGMIVDIAGSGPEAKQFAKLFLKYEQAKAVAEFGIGTNYKAKICGDILEDEKVMGTIHIAFGNNIGMGGKIDVPLHIDGIVKEPTVLIDGKEIMRAGKFLI